MTTVIGAIEHMNVFIISINNVKFAIPFRTNVKHECCYKFPNSTRDTNSVTGLDFSKAVVITDDTYLSDKADVNKLEYSDLRRHYHVIIAKFTRYLNSY